LLAWIKESSDLLACLQPLNLAVTELQGAVVDHQVLLMTLKNMAAEFGDLARQIDERDLSEQGERIQRLLLYTNDVLRSAVILGTFHSKVSIQVVRSISLAADWITSRQP